MTELEQTRRIAAQCAAQVLAGSNADTPRVAGMITLFEVAQTVGGQAAYQHVTGMAAQVAEIAKLNADLTKLAEALKQQASASPAEGVKVESVDGKVVTLRPGADQPA